MTNSKANRPNLSPLPGTKMQRQCFARHLPVLFRPGTKEAEQVLYAARIAALNRSAATSSVHSLQRSIDLPTEHEEEKEVSIDKIRLNKMR
jgi:hypothetical protein